MDFYCIGASHQTTALEVREKFSFTPQEQASAIEYYVQHKDGFLGSSSEVVLLSTCNRFEVYAAVNDGNHPLLNNPEHVFSALVRFISQVKGIPAEMLNPLFFRYQGFAVAQHLFRVSAGLDSMVLGEPQILGQIADANELARQAGAVRHSLSALFRAAIHAGKRARAETAIGQNPASIGSLAAKLAEHLAGPADAHRILVIGAGEMSSLVIKALRLRGAQDITILNRTFTRAEELARQVEGRALPFEQLPEALRDADIVISSTGSPEPVLSQSVVAKVMQARPGHPLILLDIALPRDVDPSVRSLPDVHLFDLDDLQSYLERSLSHRQAEIKQVEMILLEELAEFQHWMEIIPVVGQLHRKAENIRQQEVDRALNNLSTFDPKVQEQIEFLSRSLVKKLLHEPTMKLRTETKNGQSMEYMEALKFLFGLDTGGSDEPSS